MVKEIILDNNVIIISIIEITIIMEDLETEDLLIIVV